MTIHHSFMVRSLRGRRPINVHIAVLDTGEAIITTVGPDGRGSDAKTANFPAGLKVLVLIPPMPLADAVELAAGLFAESGVMDGVAVGEYSK